ncbi:hypothetical protein ACFX2C_025355 [Malus domestica]
MFKSLTDSHSHTSVDSIASGSVCQLSRGIFSLRVPYFLVRLGIIHNFNNFRPPTKRASSEVARTLDGPEDYKRSTIFSRSLFLVTLPSVRKTIMVIPILPIDSDGSSFAVMSTLSIFFLFSL